jgi:hypothetical protein
MFQRIDLSKVYRHQEKPSRRLDVFIDKHPLISALVALVVVWVFIILLYAVMG